MCVFVIDVMEVIGLLTMNGSIYKLLVHDPPEFVNLIPLCTHDTRLNHYIEVDVCNTEVSFIKQNVKEGVWHADYRSWTT